MRELLTQQIRAIQPSRLMELIVKWGVAVIFCAANFFTYVRMPAESTLSHGFVSFGWPFDVYFEGGYVGNSGIIWTGLIGNIAIALCVVWVLLRLVKRWPNPGIKLHRWLSELF